MAESIDAVPDHVAVAVADLDSAAGWWRGQFGAGVVSHFDNPTFSGRQLRFANGAKLELLAPPPAGGGFVAGFLDRFGTRIHHVTMKVPDLGTAVATLAATGRDVVDVRDDHDHWKEGFLRPSQVGGLVIQIAETTWTDEEWAAARDQRQQPPSADAAELLGPTLGHPDPERAAELWALLGGEVGAVDDGLEISWSGAPLVVRIVGAERAGPEALRISAADVAALEPDPRAGIHPRLEAG